MHATIGRKRSVNLATENTGTVICYTYARRSPASREEARSSEDATRAATVTREPEKTL